MPVAGVVLAAGASRRLGHAKQLLRDADGVTRVRRTVLALQAAGVAPVVVVLGAKADAVWADVADLGVTRADNPHWEAGMGGSIACGVQQLRTAPGGEAIDGVLITACDIPAVDAAHCAALVGTFLATGAGGPRVASAYRASGADTTVPATGMTRGIPAIFPVRDFDALEELIGDRGAKGLLQSAETHLVTLEGGELDLDTPDAVARWRGRAGA